MMVQEFVKPGLMLIGADPMSGEPGIPFVTPSNDFELPWYDQLALKDATKAANRGDKRTAGRIIAAIEARIGTTADHVIRATRGATFHNGLNDDVRQVDRTDDASGKVELPPSERGLSAHQIKRFDKARADLLSPRLALKEEQRDARARTIAQVENFPRQIADAAWLDGAITETLALAKARGEHAERTKSGPRIMSRNGLRQAYEEGHLTPEHGPVTTDALYEAGRLYRDAYEVAEGLTSGEHGSSGFGPKGPQVRKLEAGEALRAMRRQLTDRQREVLDRVCGQDMRLRAAATDLGRGFPSTRNALRAGLKAIVGLKVERDPKLTDHLRLKTEAIAAAARGA